MTNTVYLIKSASFEPNTIYYKIGFTSNLLKRVQMYITHNPSYQLIQTVDVYGKTKRQLENAIHREVENFGLNFELKTILNHTYKTEWFKVHTDSELYKAIEENGLLIFNNSKYRKSIKLYER